MGNRHKTPGNTTQLQENDTPGPGQRIISNQKELETCLWFKICIQDQNNINEKLIEGIYRKVEFIDTAFRTQTKLAMQNKNEYTNNYTADTNVYVKIYNLQQKPLDLQPLDQKQENVFLWHDGRKWLFSNYKSLQYYLDNINGKKQWVIIPETNADNILMSLSHKYANDLNALQRETDKIIFKNAVNNDFKIRIDNFYGKHYGKHQQQFEEDPSLRSAYRLWRDNLNIIYQRNQLFSMDELRNDEKECNDKKEAQDVKKIIGEINDICLSMQFRKLLKKSRDKSIKLDGWKNRGKIEIVINDYSYNGFCKIYIENKTNKQLANMNVRDVVLQFHKYYYQLFAELNELNQF